MSKGTSTPSIACVALLTGLLLPPALAGYSGPGSDATDVDTVTAALQAPDKTPVSLEGYVMRKLKGERYEFRDKSGAIGVDIDEEHWPKEAVNDRTKVRLIGDIDRALSCVGVAVQSIEIVPDDTPAKPAPQKTTSSKKPATPAVATKKGKVAN